LYKYSFIVAVFKNSSIHQLNLLGIKMQFITFATAILVCVSSALGAPEKRSDVGVYVCTDDKWSGHCVHMSHPKGYCGKLKFCAAMHVEYILSLLPDNLGSDLNDKISCVGPDKNAGTCQFFV
jgi:hypothetical protein